jgi:hypothetical protein
MPVRGGRERAREYFRHFPKDIYDTAVEHHEHLGQGQNFRVTMKRLREPLGRRAEGAAAGALLSEKRGTEANCEGFFRKTGRQCRDIAFSSSMELS